MPKVILNGEETKFAEGETLGPFLRSRKPREKNLIVDWNGRILTEHDPLDEFTLSDGDRIDLFSMVGGG